MSITRKQSDKRYALSFDGSDDKATLSVADAMPLTGYTLSVWLSLASDTSCPILGGEYSPLLFRDAGKLKLRYKTASAGFYHTVWEPTVSLVGDGWHHLAVVVEPDGDTLEDGIVCRVYDNEAEVATPSLAAYDDMVGQTTWARVGSWAGGDVMDGRIGPHGVWPSVLSESEIRDLYRRPYDADCIADAAEYFDLQTINGDGNPVGRKGTVLELDNPDRVIWPYVLPTDITSKAPTYSQRIISTDLIAQDTILTPGETTTVTEDDANLERETSSEVKREHRVEAEPSPDGKPITGYEVSDDSIASVDSNGNVTWNGGAEGNITVFVKSPYGMVRTASRYVGIEDPVDVDTLISWVDGSLAKAATDAIDNRIAGLNADTALKMFLDPYGQSQSGSGESPPIPDGPVDYLTLNPDRWCSDIDTSGISPYNNYKWGSGGEAGFRGGTLITPRDMLLSAHWDPVAVGDWFVFVEMDGTPHTMYIDALADVDGGWTSPDYVDLRIATFTEDVPSGITPVKLPPANLPEYLPNIAFGVPCIGLDQEEKATVRDLYEFGTAVRGYVSETTRFRTPTDGQRLAFYENLVKFDSGNPALMVGDFGGGSDELMILTMWTFGGGGSGEAIHAYLDEMDDALAATGSPYRTSDNLADLSGYTNYA